MTLPIKDLQKMGVTASDIFKARVEIYIEVIRSASKVDIDKLQAIGKAEQLFDACVKPLLESLPEHPAKSGSGDK